MKYIATRCESNKVETIISMEDNKMLFDEVNEMVSNCIWDIANCEITNKGISQEEHDKIIELAFNNELEDVYFLAIDIPIKPDDARIDREVYRAFISAKEESDINSVTIQVFKVMEPGDEIA